MLGKNVELVADTCLMLLLSGNTMKHLTLIMVICALAGNLRTEEPQRHELTFEQRRAVNEIKLRGGWVSPVNRTDERIDSLVLPPRFSDREFPLLEPLREMPVVQLNLRETNLSPASLRELLTRYPQLHYFYCEDPNLTDDCLTPLFASKKLGTLNLRRTRVTAAVLAVPGRFPNLSDLVLEESGWRSDDYRALAAHEPLRKLSLVKEKLDEETCRRLAELPQLRALSLDECALAKQGWRQLSKCPKLQNLDFDNSGLTNEHLKEIVGLPELEIVFFNEPELTFEGLSALATHPKLERISFRPGNGVDQDTLKQLDQFLNEPRLRANQKRGHLAGMKITTEQVEKLKLQPPVIIHARNYPPEESKDQWYPPAWLDEAWDEAPEAPLDRRPNRWFPDPPRGRRGLGGPPF